MHVVIVPAPPTLAAGVLYWGAIILNLLGLVANIALFIRQARDLKRHAALLRETGDLHAKAERLARAALNLRQRN